MIEGAAAQPPRCNEQDVARMDPFSPVSPAHIRVLVLPVGDIERQRFLRLLQRLQAEASIIPLADVEQKTQTQDNGFFLSPKLSPRGSLLYRFSSAAPSEQQQPLSPFELFRDALLVIGVVDGAQKKDEDGAEELGRAAAYLKERHPRVVHRQLIVLKEAGDKASTDITNTVDVYNLEDDNDASLRSAVCELSARLLVEFATYAKAVFASPTIQTPGQTARSLQTTTSLREGEKRLSSGRSTPSQSVDLSSPTDEGSPASAPSSRAPPLPATSFDQIPSANLPSARPESRSSNPAAKVKSSGRASSQDRVSVQGFGSNTSQEKARSRGKARVGIVYGSIHMLAGHWSEALRTMLDHTTTLRKLSDHLWYAKGLENMMVCMILLAWSGVDFSVPSICDPVADRSSSASAARIAAETRAAAEGTKQQLQLFRLSAALPELTRLILSLYRSTEGALELPYLIVAEASVRVAKLLTKLNSVQGHASPAMLRQLIGSQKHFDETASSHNPASNRASSLASSRISKAAVADILAQALPFEDDGLSAADSIRLLAAIASSYSALGMARKKAITIKELVGRLTSALVQARKLGAAEMGIHPAASLSVDAGTDTLLSTAEETSGIKDLMADVSAIYGARFETQRRVEEDVSYLDMQLFGSQALQLALLRQLTGLCEASPDPQGVLWLTSSLLRTAGANAAVDAVPYKSAANKFSKEEQMHYAAVIHRTVAVSKNLGLTDARATYWDPFLVRGVELLHLRGPQAVIDRSKLSQADLTGQVGPGNPLLYDPNASRPGTAVAPISVLVQGETSACLVTLQNPFDIPVDIEELELVTEGVELSCYHEPVTLGPLRLQQITLSITPKSAGDLKVTGCRIRMQGCQAQIFPIVDEAWSPSAPQTVKALGLEAVSTSHQGESRHDLGSIGIVPGTVSATVIGSLPTLLLEPDSVPENGLMLLEGEERSLSITLSNNSTTAAYVFEISDTANVVNQTHQSSADGEAGASTSALAESNASQTVLEPGESTAFELQLCGKAGLSFTQVNFFYCANGSGHPRSARVVSAPISMTVNAALQLHNLEITPAQSDEDGTLVVSYDVRNAWPRSISYICSFDGGAHSKPRTVDKDDMDTPITPGEVRRVHMIVPHLDSNDTSDDDAKSVQARFLDRLHVAWHVDQRSGVADVHGLSLSSEAIELVRSKPIRLSVTTQEKVCKVGDFISIRTKITNQERSRSGPLLVRLSPRGPETGRDEKRMAVAGTLQRVLPPLEQGAESVVDFTVCPLLAGTMELDAVVQPVRIGAYANTRQWHSSKSLSIKIETA